MTTRRTKHRVLIWLLPIFALRGLVPAGYMIDTSGGDLSVVVCPGHVSAAHQKDVGSGNSQHQQPTAKLCPFAVAGGAGLSADISAVAAALPFADSFDRIDSLGPILSFGPARAQQSRAPPHFS